MKSTFPLIAAALAVICLNGATRAADDDENEGGGSIVQLRHDVSCSLFAPGGSVEAGTTAPLTLVVRNRGPRATKLVTVSIFADTTNGTPLWMETMQIGPRHRRVRRVSLGVPMSAASLVAVARCDIDQNPGNDMAIVPVVGGDPPTAPVQSVDPAVLAGAATYSSNCASCHSADGRGTRSGPPVLRRSSGDIYEAMREGEDGMPVFLNLTRTDAVNMSKFLVDPAAATMPPAPTPDPGPAPEPGPAPVATYTASVKALLDASCVMCHTGSNAPKGIRLDSYTTAKSGASKALVSMQAGTMPPGNPATAANIKLLSDWIAGGRPQ